MKLAFLLCAISSVVILLSDLGCLEERVPKKLRAKTSSKKLASWQKSLVPGDSLCSAGAWIVFFTFEKILWFYWLGIAFFCTGLGINLALGIKFWKRLS